MCVTQVERGLDMAKEYTFAVQVVSSTSTIVVADSVEEAEEIMLDEFSSSHLEGLSDCAVQAWDILDIEEIE